MWYGTDIDSQIINPLANSVNSFAIGITPHAGQLTPAISATGAVGSHLQQMLEINHPQVPPPPPKRLRPGTTKMRPSKTSTTPRYVIYMPPRFTTSFWCLIFFNKKPLCARMGYYESKGNCGRIQCILRWSLPRDKGGWFILDCYNKLFWFLLIL